ncbi:MAG: hypothetical protein JXA66_08355 [Oligoflexia bacterium]|nr:hypothetical protein [Oligoflexia bacterium]
MRNDPEQIVIVNLLGLKELYMTLPLVYSIKSESPRSQVTLVINSGYKNIAEMIKGIDSFFFFEKDEISKRLDDPSLNLIDNYRFIKDHLSTLLSVKYDLVINVTNKRIGGIITSMLNAHTVKGLTFDEYGHKWIDEPWFNYLNDVAYESEYNLFHYMDIFTCGAGFFTAGQRIFPLDISPDEKGGSQGIKNKSIFLDCPSLNNALKAGGGFNDYNIAVFNTPDSLSAMLSCEVVISSNFETSLLASLMGIRVIHLAESDNRDFVRYGPCGERNFVLSYNGNSPESTLNLLKKIIDNVSISDTEPGNETVWISRLDSDGFIEYVPAHPVSMSVKELYRWIYRAIWKNTLGRRIRAGDPRRFLSIGEKYIDRVVDIDREVQYIAEHVLAKYTDGSVKEAVKDAGSSIEPMEKLKNLAFSGQKAARDFLATVSIPGRELNEIKNSRKRIKEIDDAIYSLGQGYDFLSPLVASFRSARDDLHVRNLFPLAKTVIFTFEDLFSRASFMSEIIKGLSKNPGRI